MAGTVTHQFDLNQEVWVIDRASSGRNNTTVVRNGPLYISKGKVLDVAIFVGTTQTTIQYKINTDNVAGTVTLTEDDVFATYQDASAEYQTRID
jgi:hypothetical protein